MTDSFLIDLAGAASDKGSVRKANEDAFMLPEENAPTELGLIYIVADGVGGQEHGAEASQLAVRIIHDVFYQTRQVGESIPVALAHAADQANLAVYDEAQKRQASRMGCTVVTAVHHEGQRYVLHAGDARAYLLRDDQLKKLTRDDTWVQRQVEEGLIGEDTAQRHELRHVVTRVLGNNPTAEFTVSDPRHIEEGDVLLLCSDGLHDVVGRAEMQQILAGFSPQAAADTLLQTAVQNKAQDNITALVVRSQAAKESDATVAMPPALRPSAAQAAPTVAMSPAPPPAAVPPEPDRSARPRAGVRLPLWALGLIGLGLIGGLIVGVISAIRQFQPADEPLPTAAVVATSPADLATAVPAVPETAMPLPTATPPPLPTSAPVVEPASTAEATTEPVATETAVSNLACVVSPGEYTFVWQDSQITGSNCDQFAQEGFILNDGDQVITIEATPIGVLGPDATCLENEFIKVQSATEVTIEGWVLSRNIQATTPEQGCPP